MYLLGHTDAELALSVYQQILDLGTGSIEVPEGVLGCSLQKACDLLTGRVVVVRSDSEPAARDRGTARPWP
jgi:hypothetical protein